MPRPAIDGVDMRPLSPKPYHLVRDRKGRRVLLCTAGDCVEAFSEIPGFNQHITDNVGNCLDFIRLRGTLAARWRISKRRKYKRLMDKAVEYKENRSSINGISSHDELEYQVRKSYRLWKRHHKEAILARLRSNLRKTLMKQYQLSEEEAIEQGGLDEIILDSSDDEF
ncbi:hypothetical protein R1sor_023066 [Riccia sorocarpa]|uniref:Uncharacterized protein n=1 Tax=Riccia sorocarpa TaxID=122646 RepID=A0ABD3GPZ0_9MARC